MILNKLQKTPEKMVAVAMALITLGLAFIIFGISWPRHPLPAAYPGTDWNDFLHGFMVGIGIALEVGGVVIVLAAAAAKRAPRL
jgi:hypothetical protein